jgi:hypothetical protein
LSYFTLSAPGFAGRRPHAPDLHELVVKGELGRHAQLLEKRLERPRVLAHMPQVGNEPAAAGTEQSDPPVPPVPDAPDAPELLVAARTVAVLGRELRLELLEGDAMLSRQTAVASGSEASCAQLWVPHIGRLQAICLIFEVIHSQFSWLVIDLDEDGHAPRCCQRGRRSGRRVAAA